MSVRKLGVVLATVCAALLIVPVAASAQSAPTPLSVTSFNHIPVSGRAKGEATPGMSKPLAFPIESLRPTVLRLQTVPRSPKKPGNSLALLHFALAIITWRHGPPG